MYLKIYKNNNEKRKCNNSQLRLSRLQSYGQPVIHTHLHTPTYIDTLVLADQKKTYIHQVWIKFENWPSATADRDA